MRRQLSLFELNLDPGGGDAGRHDLVLDDDDLDDQDDGPEDGASPQGAVHPTPTTTHTATAARRR